MKPVVAAQRSRAARWARLVGALAVPVLALAALGNRAGLVAPEALIPVIATGFALAIAAVGIGIFALVGIWNSGAEGAGGAIAGIVYALPAVVLLAGVAAAALAFPRLTDVSTDPADPPPLENPGDPAALQPAPERFALQGDRYGDLAPHLYAAPIADVYSTARALIEDRNWRITREIAPLSLPEPVSAPEGRPGTATAPAPEATLDAKATMTQSRGGGVARREPPEPEEGRPASPAGEPPPEAALLQAIARTPLFGFVDDVVLRLRQTEDGTQVDIRSASRSGMHDLGQNARRIRGLFAALDQALQPDPNAAPPSVAVAADPEAGGIDPSDAAKAAELSAQ